MVAGDQTSHDRPFFESIALKLSQQNHTVYVLTRELDPVFKGKQSDHFIKYGIGKHSEKFIFDPSQSELDNYRRLDLETVVAYWEFQPLLMDLNNQNFDLGIGGLNLADSVLFRHLEISYLKMSEQDLEATSMQVKLGMPIVTSTYPSSQVLSMFEINKAPQNFASIDYRWPFFQQY